MNINITLYILLLLVTTVKAQRYEFKKLTSKDGLSHNTVYSIEQDSLGKMWFATREGINSYDSYSVRNYVLGESKNSIANENEITSLAYTARGLYAGTKNSVVRYDRLQDKFVFLTKTIGRVYNFYESETDQLFVCTNQGLFVIQQDEEVKNLIPQKQIISLCDYKSRTLFVALRHKILMTNDRGGIIKEYQLALSNFIERESFNYVINKVFRDSSGNVWAGTSNGLYRFDEDKDAFTLVQLGKMNDLEANVIRTIAENNGDLWLGTESGIIIYNADTGSIRNIDQSFNNDINQLSDKAVYSIFFSDDDIVWVGTYFGGVNYAILKQEGFKTILPAENGNFLRGKAISQMAEDNKNNLWIATEDGGVNIFNRKNNSFAYLNKDNGLSSNNIHAIYIDEKYIWIGTFLGGINRLNKENGELAKYFSNSEGESLTHNTVYSIYRTTDDTLLVGTEYGLNYYNYKNDSFNGYKPELFGDKFIYDMLQDRNGNLWICTRNSGIFVRNKNSNGFKQYSGELLSNQIISAYLDSKDNIWFGTIGGGLLRWNNQNFKNYTVENGLPSNTVYGALEDQQGQIWFSSNGGISRLNPKTESVATFNTSHGLSTNQFNFKSFLKDSQGLIYFGAINGINYFNPDELSDSIFDEEIYLKGLKLFNQEISVERNSILEKPLNLVDSLTFSHSDNVITIEFAAINYKANGTNQYAYIMEGFDEAWNFVGNKTSATYTNLSPGQYNFKVKILNSGGKDAERSLYIEILPPFYATIYAKIIYVLLGVLIIYGYSRFIKFLHNQKLAVEIEQMEKENIREVNRQKLNFYTFISHELKTPLTLIIASVDKYFQKNFTQGKKPLELLYVKTHAKKLNYLIRQLMQFREVETDHARLELNRGDIVLFFKEICNAFIPLIERKGIDFSIDYNIPEYQCYFDASKVEMIFTNLISNAVKYTDSGGSIEVCLSIANDLTEKDSIPLVFSVKDNGRGMSSGEINKIFEKYYHVGDEYSYLEGSGIGMALVKSLIDFLGGEIHIKSEKNKGTTVTAELQVITRVDVSDSIKEIQKNRDLEIIGDTANIGNLADDSKIDLENKNFTLLIVEDNSDLKKFFVRHFSESFKVVSAKNGKIALNKLDNLYPDLIISDVKMPVLDGITFCRMVKQNSETSYIPFILVSAQNDEANRISGLSAGANSFLVKPFSLKELDLIVRNLLTNYKNFKNRINSIPISTGKTIPAPNAEMQFVKKINSIISEYYSDPKFNTQDLANKVGISRSSLHAKMNQTLNINASDYIQKIRMEKAVDYMQSGMLISEIAYKVGYNDPNYFSRAFKNYYHVTPSGYISKMAK